MVWSLESFLLIEFDPDTSFWITERWTQVDMIISVIGLFHQSLFLLGISNISSEKVEQLQLIELLLGLFKTEKIYHSKT